MRFFHFPIPALPLILSFLVILTACEDKAAQQRLVHLQTQSDSLQTELEYLRKDNALLKQAVGERLEVGFEVQIGAFEYFDINAYESELLRLQEIQEGGMNKYVLGRFRKFKDAEAFLADVRKLGLKDAFIAGVVDGQRATVAEAREAVRTYYGE